jgi:hypothetical protein
MAARAGGAVGGFGEALERRLLDLRQVHGLSQRGEQPPN